MTTNLADLTAFVAVARAGGFRGAAMANGGSASSLSEAVRRLETRLGIRLLNRSTRSVALTEAGTRLLERLGRGERVEHHETLRLTKDGRLLDVDVTLWPTRRDDGTPSPVLRLCSYPAAALSSRRRWA